MGTFGLKLRREREKKRLRLIDVAKTTRVGVHYLAALEHEDFAALPNDVFVKGFVRVYAECLEIDADQLVNEYLELAKERRPAPVESEDEVVREMSRLLVHDEDRALWRRPAVFATASVVVLSLAALWWWGGSSDGNAEQVAELIPSTPVTEPAPATLIADNSVDAPVATPAVVVPEAKDPEPLPVEPVALPEEKPEPEPAVAEVEVDSPVVSNYEIAKYGIGTGISNRQLVGEASSFEAGTRVYFWNRVLGASSGETLRHVWFHEGRKIASTSLTLGGTHWRTQSRKTLWKEGRWSVEAQDAAGNVLARSEFDCVKP